jgi:hypothetical protein
MNVQMKVHILRTMRILIAHPLVYMHQKTKIALEIAAKIASVKIVNGTLGLISPGYVFCLATICHSSIGCHNRYLDRIFLF